MVRRRFAQFFIAPLAKAEAMEREVQAVDSGEREIERVESEEVRQRMDAQWMMHCGCTIIVPQWMHDGCIADFLMHWM